MRARSLSWPYRLEDRVYLWKCPGSVGTFASMSGLDGLILSGLISPAANGGGPGSWVLQIHRELTPLMRRRGQTLRTVEQGMWRCGLPKGQECVEVVDLGAGAGEQVHRSWGPYV